MKTDNGCVKFGEFLRKTRLEKNITARTAAELANMLPSNFSKLEHGALQPPKDADKQRALAAAVRIEPGSKESETFFDLAAQANNSIPVDLADIISREEALPLLLRTIGNKRLTKDEIERLVSIVRGQNGDNKKSR